MTVTSTRRSSATEAVSGRSTGRAAMEIETQCSDPGLKIKADPKNNRVLIQGTAEGPRVKYLETDAFVGGVRERQVDYEVARGLSFQLNHSQMPDFSGDADYTRKNKWYFAHLASLDTRAGQSSLEVAQRLADKLNQGGAFRATVTQKGNGAVIDLQER